MSTFSTTLKPTPFGFYDDDPIFQQDADKVIFYVLRKLGEDVLSVELTKKMIWACFEEAVLAFNSYIIEYQTKSNLVSLLGQPTGSVDPNNPTENTAKLNINLTDNYVRPNLEFLVRQAEPYAAEVGYGQSLDTYSGSIDLKTGRQDYDLFTELKDNSTGTPLMQFMPTGSRGRMKVVEVFHFGPIQFVFNSNLASNFIASGMPIESFIPDTRFYVLPLFEDILRSQQLETAQRVRRSHFRYRLDGRNLRIFPTPNNLIPNFNDKLWVRVAFPPSAVPGVVGTSFTASVGGPGGQKPAMVDDTLFGVSSPANVPFGLIKYRTLNPWAKYWIFQYTLACCKELLGLIRDKFKNFPIPGAELQLNGADLIQQAREDKQNLISGDGGLITKLDSLSYDKLAEIEANRAEFQLKQLTFLPFPPKYTISFG